MTEDELEQLSRVRRLIESGEARSIRIEALLTLREVASSPPLGVATSTLWRWEQGDRLPRGELALAYGRVLDRLAARGAPEVSR